MTILVTGGSGFLGSHIVEQLSQAGRAVRALVRTTSDTKLLRSLSGVELAEGAVEDAESFARAARGVEAIVHSAGLVKARTPEDFARINVGGTKNAIAAARRAGASLKRLVLISSQAALGPSDDGNPVPDDAPPRPVTHYGRSKLESERAAVAVKDELPVTVVRPPMIYGPRDREVLAIFKAVNGRVLPYFGSSQKQLSLIYGADAAAACIAAIDAQVPSGSIYFVDDGGAHSFVDLISAIEAAIGRRAIVRFPLPRALLHVIATGSELYGKARGQAMMLTRDKLNELFAPHWVCDGAAARRDLGWSAKMPFAEGMRVTAEWYRSEGWM